MKAILSTAFSTALALTATAAFAADGTFDKTLTVSGAASLAVSTGSGYIHVSPGSDNQVHVVGHIHASHGWMSGSSGDVDSRVKQIAANPPIQQTGSIITIGKTSDWNEMRNISIDYDITTPRSSTLKGSTGSGDIRVEELGPDTHLNTGSGNIKASNLHGGATLETGSGDIQFQQASPGDLRVQTGSGNIKATGLAGGLRAQTGSGDIEIEGQPTSDWKLGTGSGEVRLGVGAAHFNLNADTGSGTIHIAQPIVMQGSLNKHHVTGTVNGGGPTVKADTGSGDINIH